MPLINWLIYILFSFFALHFLLAPLKKEGDGRHEKERGSLDCPHNFVDIVVVTFLAS